MIDYLREYSHAEYYASTMSQPVAQQILTSMSIIMGKDGTREGTSLIYVKTSNSTVKCIWFFAFFKFFFV